MHPHSHSGATRGATSIQRCLGRRGPKRQEGATMVEFAIVSPFAILLVLGIIQLGLIFSAKEVVNEAAFLAARAGAVANAQVSEMRGTMIRALVPFYQDTTDTQDLRRLTVAMGKAMFENTTCIPVIRCTLKVEVLNPTPAAFDDFGITGRVPANQIYIPNDNLEYRPHNQIGSKSGLSIQDANALKIKVTYGYEIKVPLMKSVIRAVMCGFDTGIDAFGRGNAPVTGGLDCAEFYSQGRIPIVSYATVQLQSPAYPPN